MAAALGMEAKQKMHNHENARKEKKTFYPFIPAIHNTTKLKENNSINGKKREHRAQPMCNQCTVHTVHPIYLSFQPFSMCMLRIMNIEPHTYRHTLTLSSSPQTNNN